MAYDFSEKVICSLYYNSLARLYPAWIASFIVPTLFASPIV